MACGLLFSKINLRGIAEKDGGGLEASENFRRLANALSCLEPMILHQNDDVLPQERKVFTFLSAHVFFFAGAAIIGLT
ncbi:MAG: hypothetical protein WBP70_15130 [Terriglobales bacterium]